MSPYEAIDHQVQKAHLQRSAYLGELLHEAIEAREEGIKRAGEAVAAGARDTQHRKGIFTFDA
jgi:hypothetical protein